MSIVSKSHASHDALGRRSRFRRVRTGKRLILGDRDTEILRWLFRYRYLSRDHLLALVQPKSEKRFVERLGELFHETGLINRPAVQHSHFDVRCTPLLYEINDTGIAYLEAINSLPHRAVTFSRRRPRASNPQFLHTMLIIDTLVDIELAAVREPDQRFVPVDEILGRAPAATRDAPNPLRVPVTIFPNAEHPIIRARLDTHIIPDALYGIEYLIDGEKRYRFWVLECERTSPNSRSTTTASSTALKHAAYDALFSSHAFKRHWGIPNLKLHLRKPGTAGIAQE